MKHASQQRIQCRCRSQTHNPGLYLRVPSSQSTIESCCLDAPGVEASWYDFLPDSHAVANREKFHMHICDTAPLCSHGANHGQSGKSGNLVSGKESGFRLSMAAVHSCPDQWSDTGRIQSRQGRSDNSPAVHCRGCSHPEPSRPGGTLESSG